MKKMKQISILHELQRREYGHYHQFPWLFEENMEKLLIKMNGQYEFVKRHRYLGPIIVQDLQIYSSRMTKCETLNKLKIYESSRFPFERNLDYILISSELWSCDRVPLPKQNFIEGFYCLALEKITGQTFDDTRIAINILYIRSHKNGEILKKFPLAIDEMYKFRYINYDCNEKQLFIHSTIRPKGSFFCLIFKLFPLQFKMFVSFDYNTFKQKVSKILIMNNLLFIHYRKRKEEVEIYHFDDILKINGYKNTNFKLITNIEQLNNVKPDLIIKKLSNCLYKLDNCFTINFIEPIMYVHYTKPFTNENYVHDLTTNKHYSFQHDYYHDIDINKKQYYIFQRSVESPLYFDNKNKLIHHLTEQGLIIYCINNNNEQKLIRKLYFEFIIAADYLDQLDTLLLLTVDLDNDDYLQIKIINNLHELAYNEQRQQIVNQMININEITFQDHHHYQIIWQNEYIMVIDRDSGVYDLYIYKFKFNN